MQVSSYLYFMQRLLFLLALVLIFSSCKNNVIYEDQSPVYQTGDDSQWAAPSYNDHNWHKDRGNTGNHLFWSRTPIRLIKVPAGSLGLQIMDFGAFDVYWDGVLIGNNGRVASKVAAELPGTETSYFMIPEASSDTGLHVLALRISQSYDRSVQRSIGVRLESYADLLRKPLIIMSFMNLMAGAFMIASIYYFFLYANSKRKEYNTLIFGVICLLFFALLIMEYIKFYVSIPYTRFYWRLEIIGWLTFAIAMLVPLYFTIHFNFRKKVLLLGLLFSVLIAIYMINFRHYDLTAFLYSLVMWLTLTVVVLNAIYQKEKSGVMVLAGLLISVVVNTFVTYDFGLFISFTIIVLCMLYLHTIRARVIEEEYQSSLLLSSRLKLELIKKNIQPHFLRNTLTSLIDWVEESPKQGVEFINALAGEFDIMNDIADAHLIPIGQEIELCKTHLSVMQFRKELKYEWKDSGIVEEEYIPPAVIHTILENGITHSSPLDDGGIHFHLHFEQGKGFKQYTFETHAKNRPAITNKKGGNGLEYVRARLTESYEDRWEFVSEEVPRGWLTTIKIYDK